MLFGFGDNLEFLIRILVVELFGFLIGLERSKRQKDAGIRTHCIIAVTSAVIMILSKYCFVDLVDLGIAGRNSDPGRMATQVVSGISFLGAGVIFRDRNSSSIKGLTTAAGMWATSAIVSPWATTPLWRRSSASASRIHPKCRNTSVSSSKATAATSNAVMPCGKAMCWNWSSPSAAASPSYRTRVWI